MNVFKLVLGMTVGILLSPAFIVAKIVRWPFLFFYKLDMSAETLAGYLRSELYQLDDDRFPWEVLWDHRLSDPELESIRKQAIAMKYPRSSEDRQKFENWIQQLSSRSN